MHERRVWVLWGLIVYALLAAFGGTAWANYGIHGGYIQDTDACAGCHRAHTAFSELTWIDNGGTDSHNALLISPATTMQEFCFTCHGNGAPGAATNVEGGVLDTAISGDTQAAPVDVGDTLNGGGFVSVRYGETSQSPVYGTHTQESTDAWMWGADDADYNGGALHQPYTWPTLTCISCHDPHGSSNYRILKDEVNDHTVGGYIGFDPLGNTVVNPDPNPWVISAEIGYPNGTPGRDLGFRLHKPYPDYQPDYTNAVYMVAPDRGVMNGASILPDDPRPAGMTGWCIACHETYAQRGAPVGGEPGQEPFRVLGGDDTGFAYRHKHPVNTPLSDFDGARGLVADPYDWYQGWSALYTAGEVTAPPAFVDLPLLHDPAQDGKEGRYGLPNGVTYDMTPGNSDSMDCLTCHRAHGSEATMTGWALSASNASPSANSTVGGVPPTYDNAILRASNRGVCERCHNK
jgi:predicted CXXCH cytochrome family protein